MMSGPLPTSIRKFLELSENEIHHSHTYGKQWNCPIGKFPISSYIKTIIREIKNKQLKALGKQKKTKSKMSG